MLTSLNELDDQTKSCIYLPPNEDSEYVDPPAEPFSPLKWRDLPAGYLLRMDAYREAWDMCLRRIQLIVHALHAPMATDVVREIGVAYREQLPGLPHTEIPVFLLHANAGNPIYASIIDHLPSLPPAHANGGGPSPVNDIQYEPVLQVHLHPTDCANLLSMMKAIVVGFISHLPERKRRVAASASLAVYDIARLVAWYRSLEFKPKLAVFLHAFEEFEVGVVRDAFYICSLHVPALPLVFLLGLSSPPTTASSTSAGDSLAPSYLHKAYPRTTLALLNIRTFCAPPSQVVVGEVIMKTFFDPSFDPSVMPGPAVLEYLGELCRRWGIGLDATLTVLQIAHMKHFADPLSVFASPSPSPSPFLQPSSSAAANERVTPELLSDPAGYPFLQLLLARTKHTHVSATSTDQEPPALLRAVAAARARWRHRARRLRAGVCVARIVRRTCTTAGVTEPAENRDRQGEQGEVEWACRVLRGRADKDAYSLGLAVRKLDVVGLRALSEELLNFFQSLVEDGVEPQEDITEARARAETALTRLDQAGERAGEADQHRNGDEDESMAAERLASVAEEIAKWVVQFIEAHNMRLDEGELWEVWYMGGTPFPAELMNPAPRLAVISALMHPEDFIAAHEELVRAANAAADRPLCTSPHRRTGQESQQADDDSEQSELQVEQDLEGFESEGQKSPRNGTSLVFPGAHLHTSLDPRSEPDPTQEPLPTLASELDQPDSPRPYRGFQSDVRPPSEWRLPDTSILFRRYVEAGRMVNVYDWFGSFAVVLERQRRHLRKLQDQESKDRRVNGSGEANGGVARQSEKARGKQRAVLQMEVEGNDWQHDNDGASEQGRRADERSNKDEDDDEDSEDEAGMDGDSEEWNEQAHARFMRALHSLDHMGFVRHTGRKADHVLRTVYDVVE